MTGDSRAGNDHRRRQLPVGADSHRRPAAHRVDPATSAGARGHRPCAASDDGGLRQARRREASAPRSTSRPPLTSAARSRAPTSWSSRSRPAGSRRCGSTSRCPRATASTSRSATPSVPVAINRALRNIPVLVGIGRDMEEICPDAWMLNITNPMTCLTRSVCSETSIKTVGLCHEVGNFCLDLADRVGDAPREDAADGRRGEPLPGHHRSRRQRHRRARRVSTMAERLGGWDDDRTCAARNVARGGGALHRARLRQAPLPEALAFRAVGRAARRGRPAPRRVPPVDPHRGVRVREVVGRRAHHDRDSARSTSTSTSRTSSRCCPARRRSPPGRPTSWSLR